jgi:hypothetical protein
MTQLIVPSRLWTVSQSPVSRSIASIPAGTAGVRIIFTRESWPVGDVGVVNLDMSMDDGVTWKPWHQFGLPGGVALDRLGNVIAATTLEAEWPGVRQDVPEGTPGAILDSGGWYIRQVLYQTDIRATLTILQNFQSALTVETF